MDDDEATSEAAILAFKCNNFVILAVDSRVTSNFDGRVINDSELKIFDITKSIFIALSGSGLGRAVPRAVKVTADPQDSVYYVAIQTVDLANQLSPDIKCSFVVVGSGSNGQRDIYQVKRDINGGFSSKSLDFVNAGSGWADIEIELNGTVVQLKCTRTGFDYFETIEFDCATDSFDKAWDFVKNAMTCARRIDWSTDGELRMATIVDSDTVQFHMAETTGKLPSAPYTDWEVWMDARLWMEILNPLEAPLEDK